MIDSGKGFFVCAVGHILLIVTSAARGLWATTIPIVVLCDFFASVALCLYMPSVMAWTYNKMRTSSSPFYFDFYMEYGWETGAIAAMAFAAATAYFGIDIRWSMAAAALGAVWTMVPLCISYAKDEKKA